MEQLYLEYDADPELLAPRSIAEAIIEDYAAVKGFKPEEVLANGISNIFDYLNRELVNALNFLREYNFYEDFRYKLVDAINDNMNQDAQKLWLQAILNKREELFKIAKRLKPRNLISGKIDEGNLEN